MIKEKKTAEVKAKKTRTKKESLESKDSVFESAINPLDGKIALTILQTYGVDWEDVDGNKLKGNGSLSRKILEAIKDDKKSQEHYKIANEMALFAEMEINGTYRRGVTTSAGEKVGMEEIFENQDKNLHGLVHSMDSSSIRRFFEKSFSENGFRSPYEARDLDELKQIALVGEESLRRIQDKIKEKVASSRKAIEQMVEDGFSLECEKYGKILVDTGKKTVRKIGEETISQTEKKVALGPDAACASGFGAYVVWTPENDRFSVYSFRPSSKGGGLPNQKKELEELDLAQGRLVRSGVWSKGSPDEPVNVKLEELLEKMAGKNFKAEGGLREYLKKDGERVFRERFHEKIGEKQEEMSDEIAEKILPETAEEFLAGKLSSKSSSMEKAQEDQVKTDKEIVDLEEAKIVEIHTAEDSSKNSVAEENGMGDESGIKGEVLPEDTHNLLRKKLSPEGFSLRTVEERQAEIGEQSDFSNDYLGPKEHSSGWKEENEEPENIPAPAERENPSGVDMEKSQLEALAENARRDFVSKEYETSGILAKIKRIIREKNLRTKESDISDRNQKYLDYKKSLENLLDYRVAKIKSEAAGGASSEKEIEDLVKHFNFDEKLELYDTRSYFRAKDWSGTFGKKAVSSAEAWKKFLDWRKERKNFFKVAGINALMVSSGLAFPWRLVSGAAAGFGIAGGIKTYQRNKEKRNFEEEKRGMMADMSLVENPEERFRILKGRLEAEIGKLDEKLKEEKKKEILRNLTGVTAGILIGSGKLGEFVKGGLRETGALDYLKKIFDAEFSGRIDSGKSSEGVSAKNGVGDAKEPVVENSGTGKIAETVKPPETVKSPESGVKSQSPREKPSLEKSGPKIDPVAEVSNKGMSNKGFSPSDYEKPVKMKVGSVETVQKGDSVWKLAQKQLEGRYSQDFGKLSAEQKTYVIDALKDEVGKNKAELGIKNIDRIRAGQKLNFGKLFDNPEIKTRIDKAFEEAGKLSDAQKSNIASNNQAIADWAEKNPGKSLSSEKVEEILRQKETVPKGSPAEAIEKVSGDPQKSGLSFEESKGKEIKSRTGLAESQKISDLSGRESVTPEDKSKIVPDFRKPSPDSYAPGTVGAMLAGGLAFEKNKKGGSDDREDVKREEKTEERGGSRTERIPGSVPERYGFLESDDFFTRAKKIMKNVSLEKLDNWSRIKNLAPGEVSSLGENQEDWKIKKEIKNLEKHWTFLFGKSEARQKKDETVKKWIARLAQRSLEDENRTKEQEWAT